MSGKHTYVFVAWLLHLGVQAGVDLGFLHSIFPWLVKFPTKSL